MIECADLSGEMEEFRQQKDNEQDSAMTEKTKRAQDYLMNVLGPYESYIVIVQRLLIWEIPWQSALLLISVNVLFWLSMTMSTYSLVGLIGILTIFLDVWFSRIWPEIRGPPPNTEEGWTSVDPHVYSVPEICQWAAQVWVFVSGWVMWLASLRQHQQGKAKFFLIMLSLFGSLLLVGQYVSDTTIAYAAVMTVLLWPCILHHNLLQRTYEYLEPWLMKLEYTLKIRRRRQKKVHKEPHEEQTEDHAEIEDDSDLEDFVPSPDPVATAALAKAITDSEDETPASSPESSQLLSLQGGILVSESDIHSDLDSSASFSQGIGAMPSYDALDGSTQNWLRAQGIDPSTTDSGNQSLDFSLAHFNEGPATLQEDYLTKDLSFTRDNDLTPEVEKGLLDSLDSERGGKIFGDSAIATSSTVMDDTPDSDLESQVFHNLQPTSHNSSQEKSASGIASTLTSVVTSDTMTNIMGTTVAGLNKIGEGAKAVASKIQQQAFRPTKGSPSVEDTELTEAQIMEEFEFLDQAELDDYQDRGGTSKKK